MNEETLVHEILTRSAAEREAFLRDACSGDDALRQRVEVLLRAHENPGSFLVGAAADVASARDPATGPFEEGGSTESIDCSTVAARLHRVEAGNCIGAYKLVEQIGEGGMGEVWMAQQTEPVRRRVALKLIKICP